MRLFSTTMPSALLAGILLAATMLPSAARAQAGGSALSAVSALPLASVAVGAGAMVALPVMLSTAGAVLLVRGVEASARGTVLVLERASDGSRASVDVLGNAAGHASVLVGGSVVVGVIASGTVLSAAGEVVAFIPNELGRSLLHHERLSD